METDAVYLLRKSPRADGRAEGLMLPRRPSLLGRVNGTADFLPEDPSRRGSRPARLAGLWQPLGVVGEAAPDDDYPSMSRLVGMFGERARVGLRHLLEPNGELLPLITAGQVRRHWLYNLRTVADVLDEGRSTLDRYANHEFACSGVRRYAFDPAAVRPLSIFKIPQLSDIHVTDRFVRRVRELGLNGFQFLKVWPLPLGTDWERLGKEELHAASSGLKPRPAAPVSPPPAAALRVRPLDGAERADLAAAVADGQSALGFDETVTPVERVQALIDRAVRDARSSARPDPERLLDQAFLLGIAWGQTLVRHRGWRWEMLVAATGEEALAVVRPDRGLAVPVLVYLKRLVAAPAADATTWLTFNMITDGRFDAPAGALSLIN